MATLMSDIDALCQDAWQAGYHPCALKLNKATRTALQENISVLKKQSGGSITALQTQFGHLQLIVDERMPDERVMLLVNANGEGVRSAEYE